MMRTAAVVEILKKNVAPLQSALTQTVPTLHLRVEYLTQPFEHAYPMMKRLLLAGHYRNVLFNLDQYGHQGVDRRTLGRHYALLPFSGGVLHVRDQSARLVPAEVRAHASCGTARPCRSQQHRSEES